MIDPATRARLYQAQYQGFELDLPFWSKLAAEVGDPILEMGCGTGRIVATLARQGYRMIGLDNDSGMLERARTFLDADLRGQVSWIEDNLTKFTLDEPVRLAIGALNTFAYFNDIDFCTTLQTARLNLTANGVIALDLPPFDPDPAAAIREDDPLDVFTDPESGSSIELRAKIDDQIPGQIKVIWLYDELLPDGRVQRHPWEEIYYLRKEEHLRRLVVQCGLSVRAIYGDYDFSRYLPGSDQLLLVLEQS